MHQRVLFETIPGDQVAGGMLDEAAKLFSEHYGIWSQQSHKPGQRIKISGRRLREQHLPEYATTFYVRVTVGDCYAGHAFACHWKYNDDDEKTICWVTQLVVHRNYREKGLASGLLNALRATADADLYGIISSNPVSCFTAASVFWLGIERVSLEFMRDHAKEIMETSPIPYVREARLRGSLFEPEDDSTGLICGVDTNFFIDHTAPLRNLRSIQRDWKWPLGQLPEGHEYLLILPSKHRLFKSLSPS
ncbi:hypothetical protein VTN49DRAFT_5687 [Thermomyces lanuginosus]|uniref:uncharacterized protein n=1 Tax=Thermomyces lanuginosus TaxID=5541 RepID=UPI00374247DA